MPLANCARCRKMFNKVSTPICPECLPEEEADIQKVREVIEREPNLTTERAAELADVDVGVVNRMVEVGVIARVQPGEKVYCGKCGAPAISAITFRTRESSRPRPVGDPKSVLTKALRSSTNGSAIHADTSSSAPRTSVLSCGASAHAQGVQERG